MIEYFNIQNSSFFSFDLFKPILFIGITIITLIIVMLKAKPKNIKIIISIFLLFAISLFYGVLSINIKEYKILKNRYRNKEYNIVEGYVFEFEPMPYSGKKYEKFKVEDIEFEYSDFRSTYAFNKTKSHGGPIDEGVYVKIYYTEGIIGRNGKKIIGLWIDKNR